MTAKSNQEVVNEVLYLYELSLSVGQSLDLNQNSKGFAEALTRKYNLNAIGVWISSDQLNDRKDSSGYTQICSIPPAHIKLDQDNLLQKLLADENYMVQTCDQKLSEHIDGTTDHKGDVAILFKLKQLGYMALITPGSTEQQAHLIAKQLKSVVAKFSTSLEGCIAHHNLQYELLQKSEKDQQLKSISKFPQENPNAVFRISTFGRVLFANDPAQKILDEMKVQVGEKIPGKLMRFVRSMLLNRKDQEFELFSAGKFYDFKLIFVSDGPYINIYGRDVTKKKLAEAALASNMQSTKLILNNALEAVINMNDEGYIIYWNKQAETCFGYTEEEALGEKLSELIIPQELRNAHEQGMKHYLKTGEGPVLSKRIEIEGLRKNGERFPVELTVIPVSTSNGEYFSSFIRDITKEREAKEALEKSEARYRDLIDNASDMIYRADPSGFCTFVNPVAARIIGLPEEKLVGLHFTQLVHADYREKVATFYRDQMLDGDDTSYLEFPVNNAHNETLWVGQNVQIIRDEDRVVGFTAVARDITVRKQLLSQIQRSEEKYRGIIENISLGLVETHIDHKVKHVNESFCKMTGYDKEELLDQVIYHRLMNTAASTQFAEDRKSLEQTKHTINEVQLQRKDGSSFWCLISTAPMYSGQGEYIGAISLNLDISDRKNAEEEIRKALEKEKELGELKSRFVSMTSHEFRTPLTTIRTNVELLQFHLEQMDAADRGKLDKNFTRIESEIKRLTDLMNDVLTIGRIESGKIKFQPVQTDLVEFCQNIINQSFSEQKDGRKLNFEVQGDPCSVLIDPQLFAHVVSNLISNAFKYSRERPAPELRLIFEPSYTHLQVKDRGIGIPEQEIASLFDSFYRAENVDNIQGTGLGLSIVKQFVEMHGASISVDSAENQGSVFTVELPKK